MGLFVYFYVSFTSEYGNSWRFRQILNVDQYVYKLSAGVEAGLRFFEPLFASSFTYCKPNISQNVATCLALISAGQINPPLPAFGVMNE